MEETEVSRLGKLGERSLNENKDRIKTTKLSRMNQTEIKKKERKMEQKEGQR